MRPVFIFALLLSLTACDPAFNLVKIPTPETYIAGAAAYALYGDDIEKAKQEGVKPSDAVPPRVESTADRVANHVRDNVKATQRHVEKWWNYEPEVLPPHDVPDTYCYRTQGDVLCYRSPMPGWEHRLVGYQGTYAKAPPAPMMKPLPLRSDTKAPSTEERIAAAQPVFKAIPDEVKEDAPKPTDVLTAPPTPDNIQEIIPDPLIAPQL